MVLSRDGRAYIVMGRRREEIIDNGKGGSRRNDESFRGATLGVIS